MLYTLLDISVLVRQLLQFCLFFLLYIFFSVAHVQLFDNNNVFCYLTLLTASYNSVCNFGVIKASINASY